MILSGTVTLHPADHAASTADLRSRLEDLDTRRRRADRSIETVLASWRGSAADAFRETWEEWSRAAAAVVDDLAASAQALDLARADLGRADVSSAGATRRLEERAS